MYSTAACFYAALSGYIPPESLDRMEEDNLVPLSARGVQLPDSADDAILKALEVRAEDRFQGMGGVPSGNHCGGDCTSTRAGATTKTSATTRFIPLAIYFAVYMKANGKTVKEADRELGTMKTVVFM